MVVNEDLLIIPEKNKNSKPFETYAHLLSPHSWIMARNQNKIVQYHKNRGKKIHMKIRVTELNKLKKCQSILQKKPTITH